MNNKKIPIAGPRSLIYLCPDLVDCSNLYWRLNYPASGFKVVG